MSDNVLDTDTITIDPEFHALIPPTAMEDAVIADRRRFTELESIIATGIKTFIQVGEALCEIRDSRLYHETYRTFEQYCRERWGFSRQRANQLIDSAEVVGTLTTMVVKPSNERVARELGQLSSNPEEMSEAWSEVVEQHGPEPTAKEVRVIVERRSGRTSEPDFKTMNLANDPSKAADALKKALGLESLDRLYSHIGWLLQKTGVRGGGSRSGRWMAAAGEAIDALERLQELQEEYRQWLENMPENLQQGPCGEKLNVITELDIASALDVANEADGIDLPMGFGRD